MAGRGTKSPAGLRTDAQVELRSQVLAACNQLQIIETDLWFAAYQDDQEACRVGALNLLRYAATLAQLLQVDGTKERKAHG